MKSFNSSSSSWSSAQFALASTEVLFGQAPDGGVESAVRARRDVDQQIRSLRSCPPQQTVEVVREQLRVRTRPEPARPKLHRDLVLETRDRRPDAAGAALPGKGALEDLEVLARK